VKKKRGGRADGGKDTAPVFVQGKFGGGPWGSSKNSVLGGGKKSGLPFTNNVRLLVMLEQKMKGRLCPGNERDNARAVRNQSVMEFFLKNKKRQSPGGKRRMPQ